MYSDVSICFLGSIIARTHAPQCQWSVSLHHDWLSWRWWRWWGSSDSEYQCQMRLALDPGNNVLSLAGTTQWWPGTWNVKTHFISYLHSYRHLSGSLAAHNSKPENPRQDTNFGCVWFGFTVVKLSTKYCESFHNILRRLTLSLWSKWWLWLRPTSNAALSGVDKLFIFET